MKAAAPSVFHAFPWAFSLSFTFIIVPSSGFAVTYEVCAGVEEQLGQSRSGVPRYHQETRGNSQ